MRRVDIFLADFDSCCDTKQAREEFLKKHTHDGATRIWAVCSARQDQLNNRAINQANKNGDCFEIYAQFCEEKKIIFERGLTVDACRQLKPGAGMDHKSQDSLCQTCQSPITEGCNKTSIITYLAHKLSAEYADHKLHFHFADDRPDILNSTWATLSRFPMLLPENTPLDFSHYDASHVRDLRSYNKALTCERELPPKMREPIIGTGRTLGTAELHQYWHQLFVTEQKEEAYTAVQKPWCCGIFGSKTTGSAEFASLIDGQDLFISPSMLFLDLVTPKKSAKNPTR